MGNILFSIYLFFSRNRLLLWMLIVSSTVLMAIAAFKLKYVEDITSFFPKNRSDVSLIFKNLKSKDKIALMFSAADTVANSDSLINCADEFALFAQHNQFLSDGSKITVGINDSIVDAASNFVFENLPLFMSDHDYSRLDSLTSDQAIEARMKQNYSRLLSPIGGYIADIVGKDPLGIGGNALRLLQNQGNSFRYSLVDNYLFSADQKTLIAFIEPKSNVQVEELITAIEEVVSSLMDRHPEVRIEFFGAPVVAAYNARQIKTDSMITLNIAIILIAIFITLAFRNKFTVLLVMTPVVYGALFALSMVYLVNGEISLIAVGAGSIILGIALSYSIHILSHTNHCRDIRQLLNELAYPLTIGSLTTIGAFVGLLFTNSKLLQDFGLFAALTLIGTMISALIFLPHFIAVSDGGKQAGRLLRHIDRFSNLKIDRNKIVVAGVGALILVCSFFYNRVGFDSNMMNLNYMPESLIQAEQRFNLFARVDSTESNVMVIASAPSSSQSANRYLELCSTLDSLQDRGLVNAVSSMKGFVVPRDTQVMRLAKWNNFWSAEKCAQVMSSINESGQRLGFDQNAFSDFRMLVEKEYSPISYDQNSSFALLFPDWISASENLTSFIVQVRINDSLKAQVYDIFAPLDGVIAADRRFFASKLAEDVNSNFYLILYISGLLIFFVLLLSYGRIEITLMSFLPMFLSWIVILGVMWLLGIEFNIVTIILSAFIFGIGDDFSIFIMDGLLGDYRDKAKVLGQHKTAIFFSAFTIVAGMGALIFAKHPAMQSLGLVSLIGIIVVVLMALIIQPFIFRVFISSQTTKGGFPYTVSGLLYSIFAFGLFAIGCMLIRLVIIFSRLPIGSSCRRRAFVHRFTSAISHYFLKVMPKNRVVTINDSGETFAKPAVVIANHQSFVDILLLFGLHRKFVMVTNGWVWNSPFFGRIVRYLGFYNSTGGFEPLAVSLREKIEQGYSVIVFPEGTRSSDCVIGRFHKGAFLLAQQLMLDIVPIIVYGNGLVSSKRQPLYIKKGLLVAKVLPRIPFDSDEYGSGYRERSKNIAQYMRSQYQVLYNEFNRTSNPYFKNAIIYNYIYKGPVLEWYMRIKLRLERWYDDYDRLLPRKGHIVDLGCGYGAMSYMLMMLSSDRRITAVDYDKDKIQLASNCFLKNDRIDFVASDIRDYSIPPADAYVISDVLHYLDHQMQYRVIRQCISNLNDGGVLIIRDGDSSVEEKHNRTMLTEKWSTRIMKFNKTDGPLCFLSRNMIAGIAEAEGMDLQCLKNGGSTSNTMFILTKK